MAIGPLSNGHQICIGRPNISRVAAVATILLQLLQLHGSTDKKVSTKKIKKREKTVYTPQLYQKSPYSKKNYTKSLIFNLQLPNISRLAAVATSCFNYTTAAIKKVSTKKIEKKGKVRFTLLNYNRSPIFNLQLRNHIIEVIQQLKSGKFKLKTFKFRLKNYM